MPATPGVHALSLWRGRESESARTVGTFQGEALVKELFAAYVVNKKDNRVEGEVTTLRADQLAVGDITIAVEYSSLNYKDGLAATPNMSACQPHGSSRPQQRSRPLTPWPWARLVSLRLCVCSPWNAMARG